MHESIAKQLPDLPVALKQVVTQAQIIRCPGLEKELVNEIDDRGNDDQLGCHHLGARRSGSPRCFIIMIILAVVDSHNRVD